MHITLLQFGANELTTRSQTFLSTKEEERENAVQQCLGNRMVHQSTITCMTSMKRSSAEPNAIDCIVCATELGYVYCIDTQAFTVLAQFKIPGVPVFLYATGSIQNDI